MVGCLLACFTVFDLCACVCVIVIVIVIVE